MAKVDKETGELLKQDIEELAKPDNVKGTAAEVKRQIPFGNVLPDNLIQIAADRHFEFTHGDYSNDMEINTVMVDDQDVDLFRHIMNGIEFFQYDYDVGEAIFIHQLELPILIRHLRSLLPEVNEI